MGDGLAARGFDLMRGLSSVLHLPCGAEVITGERLAECCGFVYGVYPLGQAPSLPANASESERVSIRRAVTVSPLRVK